MDEKALESSKSLINALIDAIDKVYDIIEVDANIEEEGPYKMYSIFIKTNEHSNKR